MSAATPASRPASRSTSVAAAPAAPRRAGKKLEVVVIPAPGVALTPQPQGKTKPTSTKKISSGQSVLKSAAKKSTVPKAAPKKAAALSPSDKKTTTKTTVAKKSVAKKTVAKKTVATKPGVNKSAVSTPAINKSAASKPVLSKPVAKKPALNKPKSGPTPRVPKRVSVHDVAAPQVRKRLDSLEATANANAAPDALTARTLIGAVIVLLVAALLIPTLRGAVEQGQHIAAQKAQLAAATARSEQLDYELSRWDDPVFIEAQARSRLGYVHPGDKVWRPIGGEILAEDVDPVTGIRVSEGVVGATAGQPWFEALLESFIVANGPLDNKPDDLDEILNRNRDN